jgi:hypothetical protein
MVNLHNFLQIKSPKEVIKQWKSRFFLLFLLAVKRIWEAQKHVDPVDPEHCCKHCPWEQPQSENDVDAVS